MSSLKQICLVLVCGMSRYDQLQNKKRLTKKEEKELEDYVNQKHWGLID